MLSKSLRPVPKALLWKLFRPITDFRFRRYLRTRLGGYIRPHEPAPTPPKELVLETSAANRESFERMFKRGFGFADRYHTLGKLELLRWFRHLEKHGFNIRTMGTVLELGCGTGRLLQHFRNIKGLRLIGTDSNPKMSEWCTINIPGIAFRRNGLEPPLAFAEDDSIDLAYAFSVFTHIPLNLQRPWLQEMRRILRPGGFLLCTVAGSWLERQFLNAEDTDRLKREGHVQYTSADQEASLSTQVGGSGWDIYQSRSEVIRIFGAGLRLLDYLPGHQDLLILQKPRE
jgi:SAM-dependent methyltransferase